MNPVASWLLAFLLTALTAAALVVGDRKPEPEPPRPPADLSAVEAELILNRIREGDLMAIKGDLEAARSLWSLARHKGAGHWPIHEAIGDSLARHGFEAEAEREYETGSRQARRVPASLHLKRAGLLVRLKQPEAALKLLIECGEPDKLSGTIARLVEETPVLFEALKRGAESRDPRLWSIVAGLAPDPAERASALGRYFRAVAPGDSALAKRAVLELTAHHRMEEALQVCADWAKAAPSNPDVFESWGRLVAKSGDRDRARLILSTIVDLQPGRPQAHARLGVALRDLGDHALALRQFEEVARVRPEEPQGMQEIVITLLAEGKVDEAASKFTELKSKAWDSRFGDVAAALRPAVAAALEGIRRTGDKEKVARFRRWCADLGLPEAGLFDIKIIMTWDASSDVDLDVTEPGGETVNHGHPRSRNGAVYPFDNTTGRGPEHYTLLRAPKGKYRVGVHLHGSTPSVADLEVILFEETPRERRLKAQVRLDGKTSAAWPLEFEIP